MNLNELRQLAHDISTEGAAIMDLAIAESREMTEAEEAKASELEQQLAKANADVTIAEALVERRERMAVTSSQSTVDIPQVQSSITLPGVSNGGGPDGMSGFTSLGDFAMSVYKANPHNPNPQHDNRLAALYSAGPTGYHREAGATEGYLVPPDIRNEIWQLVFDEDGLLKQTDLEPTSKNQVGFNADEETPWSSSGIEVRWRAEASKMDPSQSATEERQLSLHELYAFVTATDELLEDAPRMESRLRKKVGPKMRWKIDETIWRGTGTGQALGFMNSKALIAVAKEVGQDPATVLTKNILKMYSRMLGSSIPRAHWEMNSDVIPGLAELMIGNVPIWTPNNAGLKDAPGGLLLGRPIRLSEHCKSFGDKGDINFIDPKGYYALHKTGKEVYGMNFASSVHLFFDYGLQAFRWTFRFGGQPHLSAPVAPAHGSTTKSHFVTLAERA